VDEHGGKEKELRSPAVEPCLTWPETGIPQLENRAGAPKSRLGHGTADRPRPSRKDESFEQHERQFAGLRIVASQYYNRHFGHFGLMPLQAGFQVPIRSWRKESIRTFANIQLHRLAFPDYHGPVDYPC
jgi:hypothetical protein